jgi:hypothetical protein
MLLLAGNPIDGPYAMLVIMPLNERVPGEGSKQIVSPWAKLLGARDTVPRD